MSTRKNINQLESLDTSQQIIFDALSESEKRYFFSESIIMKEKISRGSCLPQWIQEKLEFLNTNGFPILMSNELKEERFVTLVYEYDITSATFEQRIQIWGLDLII